MAPWQAERCVRGRCSGPPSLPAASPLRVLYEEATLGSANEIHSVRRWCCSAFFKWFPLFVPLEFAAVWIKVRFNWSARRRRGTTEILDEILQGKKAKLNMPRSFLVKKYFSNKKPCYRESHLESQSGKFDACSDTRNCHVAERLMKPPQWCSAWQIN